MLAGEAMITHHHRRSATAGALAFGALAVGALAGACGLEIIGVDVFGAPDGAERRRADVHRRRFR